MKRFYFSNRILKYEFGFFFLCLFVIFVIVFNLAMKCFNNPHSNHRWFLENCRFHRNRTHSNQFLILFWTSYFSTVIPEAVNKNQFSKKCPIHNCELTSDRCRLEEADAIFFHWADLDLDDLPPFRSPNQFWILQNLEARYGDSKTARKDIFFNWTSSYRLDSDIFTPYGRIVKRKNLIERSKVNLKKKTKSIAWIVSNCRTNSRRGRYVRDLAEFIDVDVYGLCGTLDCMPVKSDYCFAKIAAEYKFYLSFENCIAK